MLKDHTGLSFIFQLRRKQVTKTTLDHLADLENRMAALEGGQ
jgi:hypothetical protein